MFPLFFDFEEDLGAELEANIHATNLFYLKQYFNHYNYASFDFLAN
jgi:hypothetical protein